MLNLSEDSLYKLLSTLCNTVQHLAVFSMFSFRQLNEEKTRSSKSQEALQIALQHTLKPTSDHLGPVTFSHGNWKTTAEILTTGCTRTQLYFLSGISIILSEKRFSFAHSPSQKKKLLLKRNFVMH